MEDSQLHVLVCGAYANLRMEKDLKKGSDLVDYFREVLRRRTIEE